jgi:site-specific DNA-adenine methylase
VRIGPLFKWFGSKWQSAKRYPSPEHNVLIEPFAGGGGYSLNHSDRKVTIWDDDRNLKNLWLWLINYASESDVREIPVGLPIGVDIRSVGLSYGQNLLLKHWQRTNNVGDCWTVSPWGHLPGQWTENTRARVAEEVSSIKHWKFESPSNLTSVPATWFIDPPYLYNYRYRTDLPDFNHAKLAERISKIHTCSLVIVCEAARKSDGAIPTYLPFETSHRSVTSRRKETQSHHSSEGSWIRRPTETL